MIMDLEVATWIAEMILETVSCLEEHPGLTIEVENHPNQWVQVIPEQDEETEKLSGFTLNFPYREFRGDPLLALAAAEMKPPPGTQTLEWEDNGFASILLRTDIPLVALALFIGDILTRIVGADEDSSFAIHNEYGY
jgi:hypothetical protein